VLYANYAHLLSRTNALEECLKELVLQTEIQDNENSWMLSDAIYNAKKLLDAKQ